MNISIRQLNETDWRELARIRLRALQSDPLAFGSNYQAESQRTEADWKGWLQTNNGAIFMLYENETPIGMTGIAVFKDDPINKTAIMWGSWLEPHFRKKGLAQMMYEARIAWAKQHPTIEKIIVSHRASNIASKYANQKYGFVFTHKRARVWADGMTEDEVCYELKLKP